MLSEKDYTAHTIKLVFMTKHFRDLYIYIYVCVCSWNVWNDIL